MALLLALLACPAPPPSAPAETPEPTTSVPSTTTPTTTPTTEPTSPEPPRRLVAMLHGGGSEEDRLFQRFVQAAGGGHIVTLSSVGDADPYRDWWDGYFVSLGAKSAETIDTTARAEADDPAAVAGLAEATGVWIRGGDQARYLRLWPDTALHDALLAAADRGAVIGGSSAGCAILGERAFDARVTSIAPYQALRDPYHPGLTFTDGFLDVLPGVVTDTHFTERGRLGRLLVFAARWAEEGQPVPLPIGVDPRTALFVYDDGTAEVLGDGTVTVLDWRAARQTLVPGQPPDLRDVRMWQLTDGYVLDLEDLDAPVLTRPPHAVPTPAPAALAGWGAVDVDGWSQPQRRLGEWTLANLDADPYLFYYGGLEIEPGLSTLPGTTLVTRLYLHDDLLENHQGGMSWFLSQHPGAVAVGVDIEMTARTDAPATLWASPDSFALVLDGRSATHAGDDGSQRAALEGVTVQVVGPGRSWDGAQLPPR